MDETGFPINIGTTTLALIMVWIYPVLDRVYMYVYLYINIANFIIQDISNLQTD